MSTVRERAVENATAITSMLVIGLGLLALFTGFSPIPFWVIFAIGFAVVVPIVAILAGEDEDEWNWWDDDWWDDDWWSWDENQRREKPSERENSPTDALDSLRDRYARGELTDEQFERKLDALLETESPENAAEWRTRERERQRERIEERG